MDNIAAAASYGKDECFVSTRIGASTVRRAAPTESAVSLAVTASQEALTTSKVALSQVQLLIFITQNPDHGGLPHNSAILQAELGLSTSTTCFDIGLGCSGFAYGLAAASSIMKTLDLHTALIVTSDQYGRHLAPNDANTQMIFGDGACATVLSTKEGALEVKACRLGTDGTSYRALIREGNVIKMNGRAVFGFSRKIIPNEIRAFLKDSDIALESIDLLLLHQGSRAIVEEIREALELDLARVPVELDGTGNLVSSSLPMLLKSRLEDPSFARILAAGFGVGLSWGILWLERKN